MIDINFKNYIKGKRIAFIGACPNILDKGFGEKIDKYDVVIRSNNFWKSFDDSLIKDYGKRCDVVYVNRQYFRSIKPFPIAEMKVKGISWLCLKGCNHNQLMEINKVIDARVYADNKAVRKVYTALPSATSGLMLCNDLLSLDPKELYITGIDFFASRQPVFQVGDYREYIDGYLPSKIIKEGNKINLGKKEDGHDFYGNAVGFYNLFLDYPNFITDSFISNLLYSIINKDVKQGDISWI